MKYALAMAFVPLLVTFAGQLSTPDHQATFNRAFVSGGALPRWSGGFLASWGRNTLPADTGDNLILYNRDGRVVAKWRLWFPDASLVTIIDAAASPEGHVAVTGRAVNASGQLAGFLASVSSGEAVARVIQTSPFEGQWLEFGPDGTIWVLGYELGDKRMIRKAPEHSPLRRYDRAGKLIGEYLRWPAMNCGLHPAVESGGSWPQLAASSDRIGVFLPACRVWIEFNPQGESLGSFQWHYPLQEVGASPKDRFKNMALRVVMTQDSRVFGTFGRGLFGLNRNTGTWEPVGLRPPLSQIDWLLGSDGDRIVYRTGRSELAWAKVE